MAYSSEVQIFSNISMMPITLAALDYHLCTDRLDYFAEEEEEEETSSLRNHFCL